MSLEIFIIIVVGSNDQLASKIKDITKTMSKADIQKLIDTLKSETEQAKRARAEKQDRGQFK